MKISNRLQNLEDKLRVAIGNCECQNVKKVEWYHSDISENSNDPTPHLSSAPVPDVCLMCRKPIEKKEIILRLVDHTSKERFPDEWVKG